MQRLLPNKLTTANLAGDLYGGITAAIVALPLAIAFGVASGAGPIAGLYGAICVGLFASLFGGTPSQISGPTGPMTIVSATVFTQFADRPALAFTTVMFAGGFQILFGYLRIGRYINLMPYPVISGFMTGIGCILIIMQLEPLLGHVGPQTVVNALTVLPNAALHVDGNALAIGATALLICLGTPARIARAVPPALLALLAGTLLATFALPAPVLGAVPSALPHLQLPVVTLADLNEMLLAAAVLAALGSIDSLLTSLVADNVTRRVHDSDKELIGQGIGNIAAGLAGGIPGAGATIRTLTNVNAGGRTPLSGVTHSLVLLAIVLGLGSVVGKIPHAALAGVLMKVGIDVVDWRFLQRFTRLPRVDRVLMVVVLALTVFVDVITAVGAGVVLASLAFVREMAILQGESIRPTASAENATFLDSHEQALFGRLQGRALWLHMSGPISFGAANDLTRKMSTVDHFDVLVIDLVDVTRLDGSSALAIDEIIQREAGQKEVLIVGLNFAVARLLQQVGAIDRVKETYRFNTRGEALSAAQALLEKRDACDQQ